MADYRRSKRSRRQRKPEEAVPEQNVQRVGEGEVSHKDRLGVRFKDREAFGNFCVSLAADGVSFELAGFQTVILTQTQIDQLPRASLQYYQACREDGRIEDVAPVSATGTRYLPTAEETERLLRELAEKY